MIKYTPPIIIGNWKTTPESLPEAIKFIKHIDRKCESLKVKLPKKVYSIAVPDIFIPHIQKIITRGYVGSQNVSGLSLGQVTGSVVPSQLKSGGASVVIIGHSEVRKQGEEVEQRAKKVALSLQSRLTTILCVGEHTRDKDGKYLQVLENDIKESLSLVERKLFDNLVIAYEPVWAVGGKDPATTSECFEVIIALRRALASLVGIDYAKKVKVLYGGAVTSETAKKFIQEGGVDGLLIGRASQDVTSFTEIISSCYGE